MDFTAYVSPELAVIVPVLYALGMIIKRSEKIKDNYIPFILCGIGVALSCIYVLSTEGFSGTSVFTAIVQGVICTAVAVYANQLVKQTTKTAE